MSIYRFDVNVPFLEKDEAKQLGAKWDNRNRVWYFNGTVHFARESLKKWTPRVYLKVPYAEKDEAKDNYNAKWDSRRKQWYLDVRDLWWHGGWTNIERWLPPSPIIAEPDLPRLSSAKKKPPPSARAGVTKGNATLRISDCMTVSQLKDECRYRGITGFSNKNKAWLLDQLVVDSVWQSVSSSEKRAAGSSETSSKTNKRPKENKTTDPNIRTKFISFCKWWRNTGTGKIMSTTGGVDPDYVDHQDTDYFPPTAFVFKQDPSSKDYFVGMIWYGWETPPKTQGSIPATSLPYAWFRINGNGKIIEEHTTKNTFDPSDRSWTGGFVELTHGLFDVASDGEERRLRTVATVGDWEASFTLKNDKDGWTCEFQGEEEGEEPFVLVEEVPDWLKQADCLGNQKARAASPVRLSNGLWFTIDKGDESEQSADNGM